MNKYTKLNIMKVICINLLTINKKKINKSY